MSDSWNVEFFRQEFAAAKSALANGVEPSETTAGLSLVIAVAVQRGCRYLCQNSKGELVIKYGARNQVNLEQGKQHLENTLAQVDSNYAEAELLSQLLDLHRTQRVQPIVNYVRQAGKENVGAWVMPALAADIYFYLDQTPESQQGHQVRQAWKYVARRANRGDFMSLPKILNQPVRTSKPARGFNP